MQERHAIMPPAAGFDEGRPGRAQSGPEEENRVMQPILVSKFIMELSFSTLYDLLLNISTVNSLLQYSILKKSTPEKQLVLFGVRTASRLQAKLSLFKIKISKNQHHQL